MCPVDKKGKRSKDTLHNSEEGKKEKEDFAITREKKRGGDSLSVVASLAKGRVKMGRLHSCVFPHIDGGVKRGFYFALVCGSLRSVTKKNAFASHKIFI